MRLPVFLFVAVAAMGVTGVCRADDGREPNVEAALLAGGVTIVAPLSAGSALVANGTDLHVENVGLGIAEGGLVLAPFLAHLMVGETRRGLVFSAPPAVFALATATLIAFVPDTIEGGKLHIQYLFAASFIGALLGSTIGVVDAAFAPARARERAAHAPHVTFVPMLARGQLGLAIGGAL